jgi:hypothetical protein
VETVENDGSEQEDTVASVSPTGEVEEGSVVTLEVYGAPPAEDEGEGEGSGEGPPLDVGPGGAGSSGEGGSE